MNSFFVQIFVDGIISAKEMCFYPVIPVFLTFLVLLSQEKIQKRSTSFKSTLTFLFAFTIFFLIGIDLVYLALSFPREEITSFYINNRKIMGISAGVLLVLALLATMRTRNSPHYSTPFIFFIVFMGGLVISSLFAPCIREKVAHISTLDDFPLLAWFLYVLGLNIPFLFLSLTALIWKIINLNEPFAAKFSQFGTLILSLFILIRIIL
ncbi:MAG: hypothetical protein HQK84_08935 [Nitrospinae bacterium]|nr:hypothetical protein [Nitrospinota bacterium]